MTELCDLAYKYGSGKCPQLKQHHTLFYYEMFKDRRETVRKVFEIGIGGTEDNYKHTPHYVLGASLLMWRDFFPNAEIYGADILPELIFQSNRITTFQCDQTNKEQLQSVIRKIGTDIDLAVDDGSHVPASQVATALTILPMLDKGSIYVIEDVHDPVFVSGHLNQYNYKITKAPNRKWRDDRLIIVTL